MWVALDGCQRFVSLVSCKVQKDIAALHEDTRGSIDTTGTWILRTHLLSYPFSEKPRATHIGKDLNERQRGLVEKDLFHKNALAQMLQKTKN
jgi:hypothetical protein